MRRAAALCIVLLSGCATTPNDEPRPLAVVDVVRDGETWTADFHFARDEQGWWFGRSGLTRPGGKPWRPDYWTVLTPGVRIERRDGKDMFVAANGPVPRRVRVGFRPAGVDLQADYDPALIFTDRSVALFGGAFVAEPLSLFSGQRGPADARVSFRDETGRVLHRGTRKRSAVLTGAADDYVLFGRAETLQTPDLSAVIDPALPAWLKDELLTFAPRMLAFYTERFGAPAGEGKPTIMASWAGPTPQMISQGGSVLPGLVTMRFEGVGLMTRNIPALERSQWFVAHEAAHFWLGQTVSQESTREAWIDEGGASLLAYRAVQQLHPDRRINFQEDWIDCLALAKAQPINTAWRRQAHRTYYACGALFGMIAEAAAKRSGGDFFSFWRGLIDANRGGDGLVTRAEWLAEITRLSGDPSLAADIDRMITIGVADPEASLRSLFARAGVPAPPPSIVTEK